MPKMQRVIRCLYSFLMIFGALFAALCLAAGIKHIGENASAGRQWWHHPALSNAGIGTVFLLLTVAFAVVFLRRGSHLLAPLAYATSYLATGLMLLPVFFGIEKGGAAFTLGHVYAKMPLAIGASIAITTASLIWNHKKAHQCAMHDAERCL